MIGGEGDGVEEKKKRRRGGRKPDGKGEREEREKKNTQELAGRRSKPTGKVKGKQKKK